MSDREVFISAAKRTPMGAMGGCLSALPAPDLGAIAIRSALSSAGAEPDLVDEVYLGNVVSAGLKQAPARQAALNSGISVGTPCTTVSKVCGSGMKSLMIASDQVRAGCGDSIIAGGMESMTLAPYLVHGARTGTRMGHQQFVDSLFRDGLEDASTGALMGSFAQSVADDHGYSREAMDSYAARSVSLAREAAGSGWFDAELTAVRIEAGKKSVTVSDDEPPKNAMPEKIPQLRPAFRADGSITAANASSIADGAAALLVSSAAGQRRLATPPLARIIGHASHAQRPEEFCLAPVGAVQKLLSKIGWTVHDVDLFEINEAFAVVSMLAADQLGIDAHKLNVHGGACALGHPLGASGARIVVTLIHALKRTGKQRGIASLCIGGGEATALALEIC